jgi:hypothetical protein
MTNGHKLRLNMPSKNEIAKYWGIKNYDDYCMGCGVHAYKIERAHIYAAPISKNNSCDNLLLLCTFCHNEIQEVTTGNKDDANKIRNLFKTEHLPFINIKMKFYIEKHNLFQRLNLLSYNKFLNKQKIK